MSKSMVGIMNSKIKILKSLPQEVCNLTKEGKNIECLNKSS